MQAYAYLCIKGIISIFNLLHPIVMLDTLTNYPPPPSTAPHPLTPLTPSSTIPHTLPSPTGAGEEVVMLLQRSGTPTATSFARLLTPFPVLKTFTVCYRIRLRRFREESTLMSYAVSEDKDNELRMGRGLESC